VTAAVAAGAAVTGSVALHSADLLSGVGTGDLVHILEWVAGAVAVTAILGVVVLRMLARRSVGLHVALVGVVCVVTAMITTGEIATIMLSPGDRVVMLELMGISGIASLVVSLIVGRSIGRASKKLLAAVRQVGESGIYTPPDAPLPAELAGLSEGLTEAHDKLGQARARQQALEASRRELVAWVSHDLRTPLAGLRAMAEALEDHVVTDPREVSRYHSQIRIETERLALMI
jgi:signal transduction histidine kinase